MTSTATATTTTQEPAWLLDTRPLLPRGDLTKAAVATADPNVKTVQTIRSAGMDIHLLCRRIYSY